MIFILHLFDHFVIPSYGIDILITRVIVPTIRIDMRITDVIVSLDHMDY